MKTGTKHSSKEASICIYNTVARRFLNLFSACGFLVDRKITNTDYDSEKTVY